MMKNIIVKLTVILTFLSFTACNEAVPVGDGYGRIGLNLGWDTSLATKADGDAVEVGDDTQVTVSVCDMDGNPVAGPTTYVYSALKEAEFEVPVGRYTVKASTGSNHQAAWDSPFYYGEDEVTVYAERDNQAEVICTLANVKVTVSFDERFARYCTSYSVTVDNGEGEGLTFSNENGKLDAEGYFAVTGTLKWRLVLINNDGHSYVASGTIEGVEAQQHYPLSFTLSEIVEDETGASVFKVTVDDSINEKEFDAVLRGIGGIDHLIDWESKHPDVTLMKYTDDTRAKEDKVFDDPKLMRTPIVRNGKQVTVGYCPEVWATWE